MNRASKQGVFLRAILLVAAAHAAENQVRTIQLKHRIAAEILPVIQPLAATNGVVTGEGSRLFVRTSERNMTEIGHIIAPIDTPRRNFKISVRQTVATSHESRVRRVSTRTTAGALTRVIVTSRANDAATSGSNQETERSLEHSVKRRTASRERTTTHIVRVLGG
ncbi:MAG: hypothetical protein V3V64_04820 [Acidiferrobacterales bacterium]